MSAALSYGAELVGQYRLVAGYVDRVGLYRDFNARFLGMTPAALANLLVNDLLRAGAVRHEEGWIVPAVPGPASRRE